MQTPETQIPSFPVAVVELSKGRPLKGLSRPPRPPTEGKGEKHTITANVTAPDLVDIFVIGWNSVTKEKFRLQTCFKMKESTLCILHEHFQAAGVTIRLALYPKLTYPLLCIFF